AVRVSALVAMPSSQRWWLFLFRSPCDLADDLHGGRLAGELVGDRVVQRLSDRCRVRLVEVELDERRSRAEPEHHSQVWIFHRVLGAPEYGQSEVRAADALLDARAVDVAQKLRARRLWSLPRAGEAVPAAEQRAGNGLAAG